MGQGDTQLSDASNNLAQWQERADLAELRAILDDENSNYAS